MPDKWGEILEELAVANRILGHENVLDAFGHVSIRHPRDPGRYLLPRSRSPLFVEPDDILEYDLDSRPVKAPNMQQYSERVIHGEIYKARSDVMAVCHNHAPVVMPFAITGKPIVPVFHMGAPIGQEVPFWDQHDEFGDTNLLVVKAEEGRSLARALGGHAVVVMKRHGATVVGASLRQLVARSIYLCWNADYQLRASLIGTPQLLHPGEVKLASEIPMTPIATDRAWEYWSLKLKASGFRPQWRSARAVSRPPLRAKTSTAAKTRTARKKKKR